MLSGPLPITLINLFVADDRPGVYVLYRDIQEPAYVGRSDRGLSNGSCPVCVANALKSILGRGGIR